MCIRIHIRICIHIRKAICNVPPCIHKGIRKTTHSPGLVYRAGTSVTTPPTPDWCEYIRLGLHVLHSVSKKMPGTWSRLLNIEEEEDEVHVVCTWWVIKTPVLSQHFHHLLDTFSCHFREARHVGHFTRDKPGREHVVQTINIFTWSAYALCMHL